MAILKSTLPECDDGPSRQAFKALLPCEKDEKKKVIFIFSFSFLFDVISSPLFTLLCPVLCVD